MTENAEGKDPTADERLEEIIREEKEDASTYYAQGESKDEGLSDSDYEKPIEPVDAGSEDMSFLKTVAFLGFGLAAMAIVFILFFIRDLDDRVVNTDKKVELNTTTVAKLDEQIEPFKQEINEKMTSISTNVEELQGKIGDYERMMAVMELKRAMVTIQEVMGGSTPSVKSKSGDVVSSIQSLLGELGKPKMAGKGASPAIETPEEVPAENNAETTVGETTEGEAPAEEVSEKETSAEETSTDDSEEEESGESDEGDEDASENLNAEVKEESLEGEEDEDEDEDEGSEGPNEEHSSSQIDPKNDVIPSISPISEHVGEIKLAEDSHGSVGGEEELPPIEELLKE